MKKFTKRIPYFICLLTAVSLMFSLVPNSKVLDGAFEGPKYPTVAANDASAGSFAWVNASNVFSSDNSRATVLLPSRNDVSNYIRATGFDFSAIPNGAIILGIEAEIERSEAGLSTRAGIIDSEVRIIKNGIISTVENKANTVNLWPSSSSEAFSIYGGSADLWSLAWTASDIKASDFGVAVSAKNERISGGGGNETAQIDAIRITVYYDVPSSGVEQAGYRWRNDNGPENSATQSAGFINPDGDFSTAWTTVNPGPFHFDAINEGALPDTADYIQTSNKEIDEFDMDTLAGSATYTKIDIQVYAQRISGNDQLGVNLVINGIDQSEQLINPDAAFTWHTVSFTGLSLSGSDLDNVRVKLRHNRQGSADAIRVATMRAEVFEEIPAATFKAAENTAVTGQRKNENIRVRFLIDNNSASPASPQNFLLEYSQMAGLACDGGDEVFAAVPVQSSCGTSEACMENSAYFSYNEPTFNIVPGLSDPPGTFSSGKFVEDPFSQSSAITLAGSSFTEMEYSIAFTDNAVSGQEYCFRLSNAGTDLNSYTQIARIKIATGYADSGTYISSPFNAGSTSVFNVIEWEWSSSNVSCVLCNVRMQIQTATDAGGSPGAWSSTWSGPEGDDGDETDFFTSASGGLIHTDHNGDQWIRYRATLDGDGTETPILEEVKIYYK